MSPRRYLHRHAGASIVTLLLVGVLATSAAAVRAQGDLVAPTPTGRDPVPTSRLDILAASLGLTKEQKSVVKTRLDAAHKSAAPLRARLLTTRAAIAAAVQASKPQTDVDAAVAAHAAEIAAMAQLEMKSLAEVLAMLTPEQQAEARTKGIRTPFFLFRGIFLDNGHWNSEPDTSGY